MTRDKSFRSFRAGITLILVSGLLVLLAFLAASFLSMRGCVEAAGRSGLLAVRQSLAAESGLHYAAGRLIEDPGYPLSILDATTPPHDTRGDDWTFRDGVGQPLTGSAHVSYSHGEPWTDDGDGLREAGEPFADLDRDGRFTARSGRLRGNGGGAFSLKIVSAGGLYPVNAGAGSSVSDPWLVRLGDNLGSILFQANEIPGRFDSAHTAGGLTGETIRVSHLGWHLLGEDVNGNGSLDAPDEEDADGDGQIDVGRPAKGYASLDQIRKALLANGYQARDADRILRYMDLGPYDPVQISSIPSNYLSTSAIELASAPPEMLQALLLYFGHPLDGLAGAGLGFDLTYPRTSGSASSRRYSNVNVALYPDEAAEVAGWITRFRCTPGRSSWRAFREALWTAARPDRPVLYNLPSLFTADIAPLPVRGKWAWARAKADTIYAALSPEKSLNPQSGLTWGMEPFPPEPDGIKRLMETIHWEISYIPRWPTAPGAGWPSSPYMLGLPRAGTPATLAPATRFLVESATPRGGAPLKAAFRANERLEWTTQIDFEKDHIGARPAASLAMAIVDPHPANPNARRPRVRDEIADLTKPLPPAPGSELFVRNIRGLVSSPVFNPNGLAADPGRTSGALGLAPRSSAPQGARYYFPIAEDDFSTATETEWLSDTSVSGTGPDDPFNLHAPGLSNPVVPLSPWAAGLHLNGGATGITFPRFDFRPLAKNFLADADGVTNGHTSLDEEMYPLSIEFWDFDDGSSNQTLFRLEGDACSATPGGSNDDIRIQIAKDQEVDPVTGEAVLTYSVDFLAPGRSGITQIPPQGTTFPPVLPNQGGYDMHFSVKVPLVDVGDPTDPDDDWYVGSQNHIVLTVEIRNEPSPEDANRNGQLDSGEDRQDANGNGVYDTEDVNGNGVLEPEEDLNNNGTLDAENPNGWGVLDAGEDVDNDCRLDHDEDDNGNGQIDPGEDDDGDRKLDHDEEHRTLYPLDPLVYGAPDEVLDRNTDVILGFYVNGRLVESESRIPGTAPAQWRGSWSDAFETYKTQTRDRWLRRNAQKNVTGGRGYPAYPFTASKTVAGKKMRVLDCAGDELRFYGDLKALHQSLLGPADPDYSRPVLTPDDVRNRYALGRFLQPTPSVTPSYVSPLYDLGESVRVKGVGWTGTPSGDPQVNDPGQERTAIDVILRTYNTSGALQEECHLPDSSFMTNLTDPRGIRGLGYEVRFLDNQPGNNLPLYHTPLFDGMWVTIRARTPRWCGWD